MTYAKKFKFNSLHFNFCNTFPGTRKHIAKVKMLNFVLCGVKIGVFHDSELNKSICFAPKPLLGGKAYVYVSFE